MYVVRFYYHNYYCERESLEEYLRNEYYLAWNMNRWDMNYPII